MIGILGDTPGAFRQLVRCHDCKHVLPESEAVEAFRLSGGRGRVLCCWECIASEPQRLQNGRVNFHYEADHHALYRTSVEDRDPLVEPILGWDPFQIQWSDVLPPTTIGNVEAIRIGRDPTRGGVITHIETAH